MPRSMAMSSNSGLASSGLFDTNRATSSQAAACSSASRVLVAQS